MQKLESVVLVLRRSVWQVATHWCTQLLKDEREVCSEDSIKAWIQLCTNGSNECSVKDEENLCLLNAIYKQMDQTQRALVTVSIKTNCSHVDISR